MERGLNMSWIQRKWKNIPPPFKYLTLMEGINLLVGFGKDGGLIKSCSQDFIHSGLLAMMTSAFSCMKLLNELIFLLFIDIVQHNPFWLFPIQFSI